MFRKSLDCLSLDGHAPQTTATWLHWTADNFSATNSGGLRGATTRTETGVAIFRVEEAGKWDITIENVSCLLAGDGVSHFAADLWDYLHDVAVGAAYL